MKAGRPEKPLVATVPRKRARMALPPQETGWRRLDAPSVAAILFLIFVITALPLLQGSGRPLDTWGNLTRFIGGFLPPDLTIWRPTLAALWETLQMAALATFFGVIFSIVFSALAARSLSPGWVVVPVRLTLNAIRTIPSLIWALIAVAVVGANPLAGVVGLTFYSIGYLGKFFSEAFESVDLEAAKGLRAIGASRFQTFQYGLWPTARPIVWSYSLWMFEYNIRSASIVGYVGAGGLGLQLLRYQEFNQWERFATVLLCIFVVVTLLDFISGRLRRRYVERSQGAAS
jgi:phosphonate transport system permease protein